MILSETERDFNVAIFRCDVSDKESVTEAGKIAR